MIRLGLSFQILVRPSRCENEDKKGYCGIGLPDWLDDLLTTVYYYADDAAVTPAYLAPTGQAKDPIKNSESTRKTRITEIPNRLFRHGLRFA